MSNKMFKVAIVVLLILSIASILIYSRIFYLATVNNRYLKTGVNGVFVYDKWTGKVINTNTKTVTHPKSEHRGFLSLIPEDK